MTPENFDAQIGRLNGQWKNTYGQERKNILWRAFRDCHNDDFAAAVEHCLATMRGAPLLDELSKEVDVAKSRRVSNEGMRGVGGFSQVFDDAAKNNKTADPDFVKTCIKHFDSRYRPARGEQPKSWEYFIEGCGFLDDVARKLNPEPKQRPQSSLAGNFRGRESYGKGSDQ